MYYITTHYTHQSISALLKSKNSTMIGRQKAQDLLPQWSEKYLFIIICGLHKTSYP